MFGKHKVTVTETHTDENTHIEAKRDGFHVTKTTQTNRVSHTTRKVLAWTGKVADKILQSMGQSVMVANGIMPYYETDAWKNAHPGEMNGNEAHDKTPA
jgi:L-2-hydroxyglutarate oxidase LhgO